MSAGTDAILEKRGGRITGVHTVDFWMHLLEQELSLLWKRENDHGLLPACRGGRKLTLDDGRTVSALVFIMDPRHPLFESDESCSGYRAAYCFYYGPLGTELRTSAPLEQELVKLGMQDDCLNDLVITVKRLSGRGAGVTVVLNP